jgi:hypothetical protein
MIIVVVVVDDDAINHNETIFTVHVASASDGLWRVTKGRIIQFIFRFYHSIASHQQQTEIEMKI